MQFLREYARSLGEGRVGQMRAAWLDEESVVGRYSSLGWLDQFAERHGLNVNEAAAIVRDRIAERRKAVSKRRRGRRKSESPRPYHLEWAEAYGLQAQEMTEEYEQRRELELLEEGERPPTKMDIAAAVAFHDEAAHPDRWPNYSPSDPAYEHQAAMRVWNAVKPLLIAETRISAA